MSPTFKLSCVSLDDVSKKIKKLSTRKAVQINDIPLKILKQITDIFLITFVTSSFCLNEDKFPISLNKLIQNLILKKAIGSPRRAIVL